MTIKYAKQVKPDKIEKHYTKPEMAKDLISLVPITKGDLLFDPCAGGGAFYDNFPEPRVALEIDNGQDFLEGEGVREVDWIITNPPFHLGWKFAEKATRDCRKGFAFLHSLTSFNQYTPRRLTILRERGFELTRLHIVADKRWFGRYYFLVFKKGGKPIISWNVESY
jgi:hypothetical protein